MSRPVFDHRFCWRTEFVMELLSNPAKGGLSQTATFGYFLAVMAFDWLQFTVMAVTPSPQVSAWAAGSAWLTFGITVLGLIYLYQRNGGSAGQAFFPRYFALSVTVGVKCVALSFAVTSVLPMVLSNNSPSLVGWASAVGLFLINVLMFWRMGRHMSTLHQRGQQAQEMR